METDKFTKGRETLLRIIFFFINRYVDLIWILRLKVYKYLLKPDF